jgi:DNA-directed RNA polymerase specialized sigma24 family protein
MPLTTRPQPAEPPPLPTGYHHEAEPLILHGTQKNTPSQVNPCLSPGEFAEAYSSGYATTIRFLRSRGASTDIATEVGQDAWAQAWAYRHQLREPKLIGPWVNSIAKNIFVTTMRLGQKTMPVTPSSGMICPSLVGMDLTRILAGCSPALRTILHHVYIEGRSIVEVAEKLGVTPINVRVRLCRLRKALRCRFAA